MQPASDAAASNCYAIISNDCGGAEEEVRLSIWKILHLKLDFCFSSTLTNHLVRMWLQHYYHSPIFGICHIKKVNQKIRRQKKIVKTVKYSIF
jgi:hypothetical protein